PSVRDSFPTRRSSDLRNKLFSGEEQPGKADAKFAEAAANWFIYRITYKAFDHAKVQADFANQVTAVANKPNNRAFINLFGQALVDRKSTRLNSSHDQI